MTIYDKETKGTRFTEAERDQARLRSTSRIPRSRTSNTQLETHHEQRTLHDQLETHYQPKRTEKHREGMREYWANLNLKEGNN